MLDQTAYTKYRESPDRDDRERVMDAFFGTWKTYERTIGSLLLSQLRQDKTYSEGPQVSRLDHPRARPQQRAGGGRRHA